MKKLIITIVFFILTTFSPGFSKEKPVEAWISYKQINGKVVEVIKIKTNTGKVYELYPGLNPNKIPKIENKISESKEIWILFTSLSFLLGSLIGGIVVWYKLKKE